RHRLRGPEIVTRTGGQGTTPLRSWLRLRAARYSVIGMKLRELAERLGCGLEGDGEIEIRGVAGMEHAGAGHVTFLANPKYAPKVRHTKASAILVSEALTGME